MQMKAGDAGAGDPAMPWTTIAVQRRQPAKDSRPEKGQVCEGFLQLPQAGTAVSLQLLVVAAAPVAAHQL